MGAGGLESGSGSRVGAGGNSEKGEEDGEALRREMPTGERLPAQGWGSAPQGGGRQRDNLDGREVSRQYGAKWRQGMC